MIREIGGGGDENGEATRRGFTEVTRTVYDAVRMLKAQDLVEVHHSSPTQIRAVPVDEAIELLRDRAEAIETVEDPDTWM
jgi:uncharacterized protein YqgV (UPF0045/DUF77 family)